jgi:hypothetical protein
MADYPHLRLLNDGGGGAATPQLESRNSGWKTPAEMGGSFSATVPARPGRLSALSFFHSNLVLYAWRFCVGAQDASQTKSAVSGPAVLVLRARPLQEPVAGPPARPHRDQRGAPPAEARRGRLQPELHRVGPEFASWSGSWAGNP